MADPTPAPGTSVAAPTRKLDLAAIQGDKLGGGAMFLPSTMQECVDFASIMSRSDFAIPPKFRNNPGACLAITIQASRWAADPFGVIQKAYVVKAADGSERIAYEAQLVAAVVNTRAPLCGRLELIYSGEGATRRVKVVGTFRDTGEIREVVTPTVAKCKKKSPLWDSDPDQQLAYYGIRAWGRRWVPEVLLGIYSVEELQEEPVVTAPRPVRQADQVEHRPPADEGIVRAAEPEPPIQAGESVDELIPRREAEPEPAQPEPPISQEEAARVDEMRVEPGDAHATAAAQEEIETSDMPSEDAGESEAFASWSGYLLRSVDGLQAPELRTEADFDDYAKRTKETLATADGLTDDERDDLRARFVSALLTVKRDRGFGRRR